MTDRHAECCGLTQKQINQNALRFYGRIGFLDGFCEMSLPGRQCHILLEYSKTARRVSNVRRFKKFHTLGEKKYRIQIQINAEKCLIVKEYGHCTRQCTRCGFPNPPQSAAECWRLHFGFVISLFTQYSKRAVKSVAKIVKVDKFERNRSNLPLIAGSVKSEITLPFRTKREITECV
jgi:hypothetical protein